MCNVLHSNVLVQTIYFHLFVVLQSIHLSGFSAFFTLPHSFYFSLSLQFYPLRQLMPPWNVSLLWFLPQGSFF